jgi:microcystin-dependent protein
MAFIVPNAVDTTGGNRFEALDQAEPDSLDFEVLGKSSSGVVSGCEVTSNNSDLHVAVSSGVAVLNGTPYIIGANATLSIPPPPADNRFDMVVARVSGNAVALAVIQGDPSATNPTFPKSRSVITGAFDPTKHVDLNTDVVLAAIYRSGSSAVTASRIVDKRVLKTSSLVLQGTGVPSPLIGGIGSLYYRTSAPNGVESGVWVKSPNGTWIELAQNVGAHAPIGAVFAWPADVAVPAGCLELNGQSVPTTLYPALFSILGYKYGGSGNSFTLPNWVGKYPRGVNLGAVGAAFGQDQVTIGWDNMPPHTHSLSSHTHTFGHTHSIFHGHTASSTPEGNHIHNPGPGEGVTTTSHFVTAGPGPADGFSTLRFAEGKDGPFYQIERNTLSAGSHSHAITVTNHSGDTSSQSTSTTSGPSIGTTGNAGSGIPIWTVPVAFLTRWIIRAALGSDPSYTGGGGGGNLVTSVNTQIGDVVLAASDVGALANTDPRIVPTPVGQPARNAPATTGSNTYTLIDLDAEFAPKTPAVGSALGTSGVVNLDMAALNGTYQTITLTGAIEFQTTNRAAGRQVTLFLDAGASNRTLTFPADWRFLGEEPIEVAATKVAALTLLFLGTTEASGRATFLSEE